MGRKYTAGQIVMLADAQGYALGFPDVRLRPSRPIKSGASRHAFSDFNFRVDLRGIAFDFPVLMAPMDTVNSLEATRVAQQHGIGVVYHRNLAPGGTFEDLIEASLRLHRQLCEQNTPVFMSVPQKRGGELANALYEQGQRHFCVEAAAGWSDDYMREVREIARRCPDCHLIVGNVADSDGAVELAELPRVVAIRAGIGGGSACTSSEEAGVGVPQFTCIVEVVEALDERGLLARKRDNPSEKGVYVISDGGIRSGGDIAKALGAHADLVMIGGAFAAHDESPGEIITDANGNKYKWYRGMSSKGASADQRGGKFNGNGEGVQGRVRVRGPLGPTIDKLRIAFNSSVTQARATNADEFRDNARFVRLTELGAAERAPASYIEQERPN